MTREPLLLIYRGDPLILNPGTSDGVDMYSLKCPKCGQRGTIILHPEQGHAIWKNERGNVQVQPSLVCGNEGCTWHVVVEEGVARDV